MLTDQPYGIRVYAIRQEGAVATADVVKVLGGPGVLKKVSTEEDLRECLREGLPYEAFEALRAAFGLSLRDLGAVLGVPERTLARRKLQRRLRPDESDRLARLARIAAYAEDVLGGRRQAADWLRTPNRALGNEPPVVRLDTDLGARQIESVLGRIAHGVYS
jgi:putative toxin-antitoxin system antitoxin component (TIGR02293 family)